MRTRENVGMKRHQRIQWTNQSRPFWSIDGLPKDDGEIDIILGGKWEFGEVYFESHVLAVANGAQGQWE